MCGICGIWGESNKAAVNTMVAVMHHRGPDDSGIFCDPTIGLGMTRLAIIDLSPAAHQPMSNPEKTIWIVFNGEIYNFQEKRAELEKMGYHFSSNSDTEVILKLYEHYHDDFLLQLRGMFALAIYDKRNKARLLLARDHFGIKPLLYSEVNGKIVFASEIKALLATGMIDPQVDPEALRLLLTYGSIYQPTTIITKIKSLLPAHKMILEDSQVKIERYWSLSADRQSDLQKLQYHEQVDILRQVLVDTVRKQMISDVPLGAFLSGGIDSSLLVGILAQEAGRRIKTFSVGFDASGAAIDESNDAKRTADILGTDHTHVPVRGEDIREHIFHIAAGLDQPSVDGVNSYFVSMAARRNVTVAISGTGGDELFAGYPWFINANLYRKRSQMSFPSILPLVISRLFLNPILDPFISSRWGRYPHFLRRQGSFLENYSNQYQIFGPYGAARLFSDDMKSKVKLGVAESIDILPHDELMQADTVERVSALCLRGYTANQLLRDIDSVSMSHSLEVRVPYLDPVIADIALSLPSHTKLNPNVDLQQTSTTYRESGAKKILIDAGNPWLPKDIDMQQKHGFTMPFANWLKGSLKDILLDTLSEESVKSRGWFKPDSVNSIKSLFFADRVNWAQPWLIMMIELWARKVLDHAFSEEIIHE